MRENTLSEGDEVALTFIRESRITGTERRTVEVEVREAMGLMAVENLRAALNGETPPNLIA